MSPDHGLHVLTHDMKTPGNKRRPGAAAGEALVGWQPWGVEYQPAAIRDLERLDRQVARRVLDALRTLAATGQGAWKPLKARGAERSLRVGDWRVIFVFDTATRRLSVLRVLPRGRAYRR